MTRWKRYYFYGDFRIISHLALSSKSLIFKIWLQATLLLTKTSLASLQSTLLDVD